MGTLNRAVTTVKKMFGFGKNKPIEPPKVEDKNADYVPIKRRYNSKPNKQNHPTISERRDKRREQGKSRNINHKKASK